MKQSERRGSQYGGSESFYEETRTSSLTDNSDSKRIDADILESVPVVPRFSFGREDEETPTDSAKNASDIIYADDKSADDLFAEFDESLLDDLLAVYTGRVVKLRFFELGGDGRIGERWGAFVFQG